MQIAILIETYEHISIYLSGLFSEAIRGGILAIVRLFIQNKSTFILPLFRLCQYPQAPKLLHRIAKHRYYSLCDRYSVYLPIETKIGTKCTIPHGFPLVINPDAVIGDNCIIHPCVLIGRDRGKAGAPKIGDNCFIGHGAKIIGNPHIGNWSFLSPGAIVTKNIPEGSLVGAGVNNILSNRGKDHVILYN